MASKPLLASRSATSNWCSPMCRCRTDGFALTVRFAITPRSANLPVVILTSLTSEQDRQHGLDAGADGYIVKTDYDETAAPVGRTNAGRCIVTSRCTAQRPCDRLEQRALVEARLHDVGVGPGVEPFLAIVLAVERRDDEHRQVRQRRRGPESLASARTRPCEASARR